MEPGPQRLILLRKGSALLRPVRNLLHGMRRRPGFSLLVGCVLGAVGAAVAAHLFALFHYDAAQRALREDRHADARRHVDWCLIIWPSSLAAHLLAARIERSGGNFVQAEEHLNEVKRLEGHATEESQLEWLLLRAQQGEVDEVAPALWDCVHRGHPQTVPILETLARTYMHELRFHPAHACLNAWLEREKDSVRALDWRGWVRERLDLRENVVDDYRRALEMAPQRSAVRLRLAQLLLDKHDPRAAWPHLRRLRAESGQETDVLVVLARCRMLQGKWSDARDLLALALASQPRDPPALYYRGKVELLARRPADAERWFRQALRQNPFDLEVHNSLYESLRQQGGPKKAAAAAQRKRYNRLKTDLARLDTLLRQEIEAAPRSPDPPSEAGAILLRIGQAPLGLYWLSQALKRDRRHTPTHEALARYYAETNQPQKAAAHRRLAIKAAPGP